MKLSKRAKIVLSTSAVALVCAGGGVAYLAVQQHSAASRELASRYTADGYGGYTGRRQAKAGQENAKITPPASAALSTPLSFASAKKPLDLIVPVRAAYTKGDYKQAEAVAGQVVEAAHALPKTDPKRPAALKVAARARYLQAFASARQHNMKQARERFAQLKVEASALPDKGKVLPTQPKIGAEPEPTLLESAAYQHAVCTSALGDKEGAEREYIAFMKAYPDSPLVQASIKRIARLHNGDIPKEAESVWQSAMKTAQAHDKEQQKQASLCAPQCLAELLKRQGKAGKNESVVSLANEMKTNERGTSIADLCASAKRHGFSKARGVALTEAGLKKQKMPLVALVSPGHFVLVDQVQSDGTVRVWNPTGTEQNTAPYGIGKVSNVPKAEKAVYPATEWKQVWQGVALVVH